MAVVNEERERPIFALNKSSKVLLAQTSAGIYCDRSHSSFLLLISEMKKFSIS